MNLLAAVFYISKQKSPGVAVCMHEDTNDNNCLILSPTKCRKMHSSRRDAFRPINSVAIAVVNNAKKTIKVLSKTKMNKGPSSLKLFNEKIKIALLKIHPNMSAKQFSFFNGYEGLVIEGSGLAGNIPINEADETTKENGRIEKAISSMIKSGTIIATSSQTIYGRLDMNVYTTGRKMQELGIIGDGHDMTPETAFIKLAWLLSNHKKEVKKLFTENLRGEISLRSEKEGFLV